MTYLFIADLHLSPNHPRLVRGFLDLLDAYPGKNVKMDAIQATIIPIPHSYDPANDDIIGKFAALAYDLAKDSDQARTPFR